MTDRRLPPIILPGMELRISWLGDAMVRFGVTASARGVTARWHGTYLGVTVPPGARTATVMKSLEGMAPKILAKRPTLTYTEGETLTFDGLSCLISRQSLKPYSVALTGTTFAPTIGVGSGMSMDDPQVTAMVSRMLLIVARKTAPHLLLPMAREYAAALNLQPRQWKISHGHRTLGTCRPDGTISLSEVLVFLPLHLRMYIIAHELAHLTEMNHSPRFHALCDAYCGGQEKRFIKELKQYKWPILRR